MILNVSLSHSDRYEVRSKSVGALQNIAASVDFILVMIRTGVMFRNVDFLELGTWPMMMLEQVA